MTFAWMWYALVAVGIYFASVAARAARAGRPAAVWAGTASLALGLVVIGTTDALHAPRDVGGPIHLVAIAAIIAGLAVSRGRVLNRYP